VWIGLPTAQDYVKAADIVKKPLMAAIGGATFPVTAAAMKAARVDRNWRERSEPNSAPRSLSLARSTAPREQYVLV